MVMVQNQGAWPHLCCLLAVAVVESAAMAALLLPLRLRVGVAPSRVCLVQIQEGRWALTHSLGMFLVVETVLTRGRRALLQWFRPMLLLVLRVWVPDHRRARLVRVNNRMCQPKVVLGLVLVVVAVARVVERVMVVVVEAAARARLVRVNHRMCQSRVGLGLVLVVVVVVRVVERVVVAVVEAAAFTRLQPTLGSRALRLKVMMHLLGPRQGRLLGVALVAEDGATGAVRGVGGPLERSGRLRIRRLSALLVVSEGRTLLWILRAIAVSSSTGCIVARGNP